MPITYLFKLLQLKEVESDEKGKRMDNLNAL